MRYALELLEPEGGPGPVFALEREAARRALELGLADDDLRAGWHTDRWYEEGDDLWADPLTGRWFGLLDMALGQSERDAVVRAWLSWGTR